MLRLSLASLAVLCVLLAAGPAAAQSGAGVIDAKSSVWARATPGGNKVTKLRVGRRIAIACQVNGPAANGRKGRSAVWNRTRVGSRVVFVADTVVNTGGDGLVAGYCGAPGPVSPVTPGTSGACSLTSPVPLNPPFGDRDAFIAAAVPGAQQSDRETQVPAAVTLAQAILESGWGRFSAGANNYFGIKAKPTAAPGVFEWSTNAVGCVLKKTLEEVRGRVETQIGAFRAYRSLTSSIRDHGARLRANPVYAPAFEFVDDNKRFVRRIARFYATDSKYASKVMTIIENHKLEKYDIENGAAAASGGGAAAP